MNRLKVAHLLVTLLKRVSRVLVGQEYKVYIDDVLVTTVKSRTKDVQVVIPPGVIMPEGNWVLRTEPPIRVGGSISVIMSYDPDAPLTCPFTYKDRA